MKEIEDSYLRSSYQKIMLLESLYENYEEEDFIGLLSKPKKSSRDRQGTEDT